MLGSNFICNLCGQANIFNPEGDWREASSCSQCHSSVRVRQIVHCLTSSILGQSLVLNNFKYPEIRGAGLSDAENMAQFLRASFDYENTYYHQEPKVDICNPDNEWQNSVDFLISSDVFEHVSSPVQRAFDGAYKMLRPGGMLILTVPFDDRSRTTEHFENVRDFRLLDFDGDWLMIGRTEDRKYEIHSELLFHGGPGTTVEMRFFARAAVLNHLSAAGFKDIQVHEEAVSAFGIYPPHNQGLPITARRPLV